MILGQEPMDYAEEIRWGTKFTAKLDYHSSRGYLLLCVIENSEYIYDLESSRGGISILQDGIFITQVDHLLPENARNYIIGRLNLVGEEKCELSMDRNRIYWGKGQLAQTKNRIMAGIVTIANRLMVSVAQQSIPENIDQNLTRKLALFFDFNDVDDTVYDNLNRKLRIMVEDKLEFVHQGQPLPVRSLPTQAERRRQLARILLQLAAAFYRCIQNENTASAYVVAVARCWRATEAMTADNNSVHAFESRLRHGKHFFGKLLPLFVYRHVRSVSAGPGIPIVGIPEDPFFAMKVSVNGATLNGRDGLGNRVRFIPIPFFIPP